MLIIKKLFAILTRIEKNIHIHIYIATQMYVYNYAYNIYYVYTYAYVQSPAKLHSILAVANLLAHNNKSQICYCVQISLQSAAVDYSFSDTFGGNIYFAGNVPQTFLPYTR